MRSGQRFEGAWGIAGYIAESHFARSGRVSERDEREDYVDRALGTDLHAGSLEDRSVRQLAEDARAVSTGGRKRSPSVCGASRSIGF